MTQLIRAGTANNLSAVVGFPLSSEKYTAVACCPTNGGEVVETQRIIFEQNEGGSFFLTGEEETNFSTQEDQKRQGIKMAALKEKFKLKLEQAKKLREKIGDPITLGRSIIEIPEDKAEQKLDEVKGFKYVSKKA